MLLGLRHIDRSRSPATILPVARLSMQMHHCDNLNPAIPDAVDDSKRKSGDTALTPRLADQTIHVRMSLNPVHGLHNGFEETSAKTCLLRFIVDDGFQKLYACFWMKPAFHLCSLLTASVKTPSPGVNSTSPSSIWRQRLSTSSLHSLLRSNGSSKSRLSSSFSARKARTWLGSSRACFITCSILGLML